jgi:hypothetical protein
MESKVIAQLILNLSTKCKCVVCFTTQPLYPEKRGPQKTAGWVSLTAIPDDVENRKISFLVRNEATVPWYNISCLKLVPLKTRDKF